MASFLIPEREFLFGLTRSVVEPAFKGERRRLRFFCEFLRPLLPELKRPALPIVVDLIERFIDGDGTRTHLVRAHGLLEAFDWKGETLPLHEAGLDVMTVFRAIPRIENHEYGTWLPLIQDSTRQKSLLRDIFGNPFRPVAFDPAWRTHITTGIAKKMYSDRNFSAMPILADALEEAGCDSVEILLHCREAGKHVRGCWVVDLVLDKK